MSLLLVIERIFTGNFFPSGARLQRMPYSGEHMSSASFCKNIVAHRLPDYTLLWVINGFTLHAYVTKTTAQSQCMICKILSQRMEAKYPLSGDSMSLEKNMNNGLPTIWSSGTNPQNRLSCDWWRLSPIIQ